MRTRQNNPNDIAFARLALTIVALEFGQPDLSLDIEKTGPDRRRAIFVRQVAIYVAQTVFDLTATRLGELFSRDRSTITHAVRVVEDSREDPVFNRKLLKAEDVLSQSYDALRAAA
ncbi:hypothetical protein GCM10011309_00910 [Litorimonas cladophorae]|uniref:Chromosomal replication initiator DnaA C-terminal domain-containing protein n=1 Tax=Litorimonas cladophorae TaxID=1220491 RepID=A0A918K9W0_9PROT|nr:helix-turn-helix domain-containing protein [Litorimonas cladophorae]GGX56012.1 hypothetical protein GCM10011309_00910 [Litorimonas cladophorae]